MSHVNFPLTNSPIKAMISYNVLYKLIKSLKKREKIYFKRYVGLYSVKKEQDYLVLFDIIEKLKTFDDGKIKQLIRKRNINNVSAKKAYLYESLLNSLAAYQASNNIPQEIQRKINHAKILSERSMIAEALAIIYKAKKIAYQYEEFSALMELIELENGLLLFKHAYQNTPEIDALRLEQQEVLTLLENKLAYRFLNLQLFDFEKDKNTFKQNVETKILSHPLLKSVNKALSNKAKIGYYHILTYALHRTQHTGERLNNAYNEYIQLMEQQYHFSGDLRGLHIVINNYLIYAINQKNNALFLENYNKLLKLKPNSGNSSNIHYYYYSKYQNIVQYYSCLSKHENIHLFIQNIEEEFVDTFSSAPLYNQKVLCFKLTRLYIYYQNYEEAQKWVHLFLSKKKLHNDLNEMYIMKLMNIIIHIALNNRYLVNSEVRSTHRLLKKNARDTKFEESTLKYLNKLANDKEKNRAFYKTVKTALIPLLNPTSKSFLKKGFNILNWLESEHKSVSMIDLCLQSVEK